MHQPHDTLPPLRLTQHATGVHAYRQASQEATKLQVCNGLPVSLAYMQTLGHIQEGMIVLMIRMLIIIIIITIIVIIVLLECFPACDELGTCRTSLVSPEQPVLCIPTLPSNARVHEDRQ